MRNAIACTTIATTLLLARTSAADIARGDDDLEITNIYTDLDEWLAEAPEVTVIDFTEWTEGTQITDQYAALGVTFTDGFHWVNNTGAAVDEWALTNNTLGFATITMEFDQPFNVIGTMFPGVLRYDLFLDGEYVGWTNVTGCIGGSGCFSGLITEIMFDEVRVTNGSSSVSIDNLYFSFLEVPAPAAALPLLAVAGLAGRTRRRRTCGR